MSGLVYLLKEIEESLKRGDRERTYNLGVFIAHMGWFNRLNWFMKAYKERFGNEELDWFKEVKYAISVMNYDKAKRYAKSIPNKRILYEYLGINPLAYYYSLKELSESIQSPEIERFWKPLKNLYFKIYKGEDVPHDEVFSLEIYEGERGLNVVPQIIMRAYVRILYCLINGAESREVLEEAIRVLDSGLKDGYHHTALRLLQPLIPYMVFMGLRGKATQLVELAINTAEISKNAYMYEWFKIYGWALKGFERDRVKKHLAFYSKNRYVYHTLMTLYLLNSNDERIEKYTQKYWHKHTLHYIKILKET